MTVAPTPTNPVSDARVTEPRREAVEAALTAFFDGTYWGRSVDVADHYFPRMQRALRAAAATEGSGTVAPSQPADPSPEEGEPTTIRYTNWRGEKSDRTILVKRIFWGSNERHKEPQWLIEAVDQAKGDVRTFALAGIGAAATSTERAGGDVVAADGLEPPGCPLPGMCSCPGGEAELSKRLGAEQKRVRELEAEVERLKSVRLNIESRWLVQWRRASDAEARIAGLEAVLREVEWNERYSERGYCPWYMPSV